MLCFDKEEKHNIIYYNEIITDKEKKEKEIQELRIKIGRMNEDINNIIETIISKLKMVIDNIEIYYEICNNFIKNYDYSNRNYEIIKNMNEIINKEIINDINDVINDNNTISKYKKIIEIFKKMKKNENINIEKIYEKKTKKIKEKIKTENLNNDNLDKNYYKKKELYNDEIIIQYNIDNKKNIKIFDSYFIKNNKDKCKFILKDKIYEL